MTSSNDSHSSADSTNGNSDSPSKTGQNDPTLGEHTLHDSGSGPVDPQANTNQGSSNFDPIQSGPSRHIETLADFVESVSLSGLLTREELEQLQENIDAEADPKTFADSLVRKQKLTSYQSSVLQRGHVRGLLIGSYEVLDMIGHGGMGVVYRARHRKMRREVALKILPVSSNGEADGVDRFAREVEAAARLQHPNIAAAFDADEHGNMHYLAMELVDGPNLSGYVKEAGPLPLAIAVQLMLQAANGLAYAHGQGVVHRDIKPGNLLVNRNGVLKILDMGLAQFSPMGDNDPERAELTQSGRIMGTVDYMAPEQAVDAKSVDSRADIYSVGCTLYYLLAGEPMSPPGPLTKKLLWHQNSPPNSLRAMRPEVPQRLDEIYLKMVAKTADERQQSMAEVVSELQSVLSELSYADLKLPLVGITLNTNPGSTSGSSSQTGDLPSLSVSEDSSASYSANEPTLAGDNTPQTNSASLPWLAIVGVAVVLLAAVAALIWQPWRGADVAGTGNGNDPANGGSGTDVTPGETPDNNDPEVPLPALLVIDLPEGATVYFDGEPAKSFRSDGKSGDYFSIEPGEHTIRVTSAAGESHEQVATLSAETTTRIDLPFATPAIGTPTVNESLLAWIFANEGTITASLRGEAQTSQFREMSDRLKEPHRLVAVDLSGSQLSDADLARLASAADSLQSLSLARASISDAGVAHLRELEGLHTLDLSETNITDDAVEHLIRLPDLADLDLSETQIGNASVAQLLVLTKLRRLDLSATSVSDLGVLQLSSLPKLAKLELFNTIVSAASVSTLKERKSDLNVIWNGPDRDRDVALKVQKAGGTVVYRIEQGDGTSQILKASQLLPSKRIDIYEIDLTGVDIVDESILAQFSILSDLDTVRLGSGNYTLQGLGALRGAKKLTTLDIGALQLPEGNASLQQALASVKIESKPPADVAVARWLLEQNAEIDLRKGEANTTIRSIDSLPQFPYQVTAIRLQGEFSPSAEIAKQLTMLRHVSEVSLSNVAAEPGHLSWLGGCLSLNLLTVDATEIAADQLAQLANLPQLSEANFRNVKLDADKLAAIGSWPHMTGLALVNVELADNAFARFAPATDLTELDLSSTNLTDSAVPSLVKLTKLKKLDVRETSLTDAAREQLRDTLAKTEVAHDPVDPQRNVARWVIENGGVVMFGDQAVANLSGIPREALPLTSIDLSDVHSTKFEQNEIANALRACPNLTRVVLDRLPIGSDVPAALATSGELTEVSLANTTLRDDGLRTLTTLSKLKRLNISNTRVTRGSMALLTSWPDLEVLQMGGLTVTDADLAVLSQLTKLTTLDLSSRYLGDPTLEHIAALPLTSLELRNSRVTDAGLKSLTDIGTLQTLDLGRTKVTDGGVASINKLPLLILLLDGTDLTNGGLSSLGQMKTLRRLDVSQTKATKEGVASLREALPMCQIPATSLQSEEDRDPQGGAGGLFGG